ncbi:ABC transporter permease subunit [Xinfangfangia sp. CPCC 101601]|uniref:ABC transporter permease subunit n=1 Tax=Pseudogemmobacter lacusdianii TaxID=3069608 RepID=A0ABU0W370_9RHOB|nr:ABC transporter permease subunit [Xinfangfangia sp. CPCC 101601]MDQ2067530.1 ABC transporter permease subunit [Xinfangfangia sp. CPCC 101601]
MDRSSSLRYWLSPRWLGVAPFFLFVGLFLILPALTIVIGAFRGPDGGFTLDNLIGLNTTTIRNAYWVSIKLSFWSALLGCLIGFAMASAVVLGGLPKVIRSPLLTFSGVASNFAGLPLAFAFIATIGPAGLITVWLRTEFGINLRGATGFNLFSTTGLIVTYLFFQVPLMILIITPALDGLRKEWREAAETLGASGAQYWRMVAFPILLPSLLGTFALLFANSFGAVATAFALAGPQLNIAPILLFSQIRGDVLGSPGLGYALAFGMIVITGLANTAYLLLRARTERWQK